ncbi:MAG TPA: aldo/keto reductase [Saprospiraceae bacterium]|nr:aldo/keto reductase [Saprospiraceae bacterium]
MEYRRLGKSGLQVSALSLGSWITFGNQISDDVAEQLMITAYEAGVNFFDNAEIYANGKSEIVMGNIIKKLQWDRSSYVVSSKVYFGDGRRLPNQHGLSRKHLIEGTNDALKRMQVEYLDLLFCHRPDKQIPTEEIVWTMTNLIQQGKILYWGTSEWSAQEIMEAHFYAERYKLIPPVMEQPEYNMFRRYKVETDFSRIYENFGLGTTIWSPLASGMLTGKYKNGIPQDARLGREELNWLKEKAVTQQKIDIVQEIGKVAEKTGLSLPVFAIAWCLKNPNVSTVILGASKVAHLQETLTAIDNYQLLTPDLMDEVDGILNTRGIDFKA